MCNIIFLQFNFACRLTITLDKGIPFFIREIRINQISYIHYSQVDPPLYRLYRDFEVETNQQLFRGSYWENIWTIEKFVNKNISPMYISEKLRLLIGKTLEQSEFNRHIFRMESYAETSYSDFYEVRRIFQNHPVLLNNQYEVRMDDPQRYNFNYIKCTTSKNLLDFWSYLKDVPSLDNGKMIQDLIRQFSNNTFVSIDQAYEKIKENGWSKHIKSWSSKYLFI
uniref:hypothetical protein n=1 Tax=Fomes fomentarius TaxID=40442 RepID=UPI00300117F2|nr:hypothetical protein [Fomes fomentarius]